MSTTAIAEKVKHTPGPWKFSFGKKVEDVQVLKVSPENDTTDRKGWESKVISICSSNNEILCDVKAYTTDPFLQDFDQWAANCKLIACAPDMYDIIKELYDWSIRNNTKGPIFPKLEAVINKINQ